MTKIIKVDPRNPELEKIREAAEIIKRGGIVAFPTETVYGLGADGMNPEAVRKIFELKGRPKGKPLLLHLSSKEEAYEIWEEIPKEALILMEKFWPGPLTIVLKKKEEVPLITSGGKDTIGARVPGNEVAILLIRESETPLAAPSANPSGKPSPIRPEEVLRYFEGRIEAIVDGGETKYGIESTVIDLTCTPPKILRLGAVPPEDILSVLRPLGISEIKICEGQGKYELKLEVILALNSDPIELWKEYSRKGKTYLVLFEGELPKGSEGISFKGNLEEMARRIFSTILKCEDGGYKFMVVQPPPRKGVGRSVLDRLFRACRRVK